MDYVARKEVEIADFCGYPVSLVNEVMMDEMQTVEGA